MRCTSTSVPAAHPAPRTVLRPRQGRHRSCLRASSLMRLRRLGRRSKLAGDGADRQSQSGVFVPRTMTCKRARPLRVASVCAGPAPGGPLCRRSHAPPHSPDTPSGDDRRRPPVGHRRPPAPRRTSRRPRTPARCAATSSARRAASASSPRPPRASAPGARGVAGGRRPLDARRRSAGRPGALGGAPGRDPGRAARHAPAPRAPAHAAGAEPPRPGHAAAPALQADAPDFVTVVLDAHGFPTCSSASTSCAACSDSDTADRRRRAPRARRRPPRRARARRARAAPARAHRRRRSAARRAWRGMTAALQARRDRAGAGAARRAWRRCSNPRAAGGAPSSELTRLLAAQARAAASRRPGRPVGDPVADRAVRVGRPEPAAELRRAPRATTRCSTAPGRASAAPRPHAYQASKAEQDRLAATLWAGGAGAHNWVCAALVGI